MRTNQYFFSTVKEIPNDADLMSHQLMLRSRMIRRLASGLYSWLPIGLRVLRKAEKIIREEMNNIGAMEISMPIVQPANLWKESGRWIKYGPELLRFKNRNGQSFVLGPTHEEVITDLIRNLITSYKEVPLKLYQIQTKFRDEIRPRLGIIRSKEFLMKDAYSFHTDQASLQTTYADMYHAYATIFSRMGLNFKVIEANTGSIGGNISHEFQVIVGNGDNDIALSTTSDYAANIELAEAISPIKNRASPTENIRLVDVPDVHSIAELLIKCSLPAEKIIKTLLVHAHKDIGYRLIALIIRGDHQLNRFKAEKLSQVATPLIFASEEEIRLTLGVSPASIGPINIPIPIIIDRSVATMSDFVAGANIEGKYFFGINWERDLPLPQVADIRKVVNGDISPDGNGVLKIKRGIEVGHIFQLGTKYSEVMKAKVQKENGLNQTLIMGCYGIGITRVVAAAIEQNHDDRGILWSEALAPFSVVIIPINMHKSFHVRTVTEDLYLKLKTLGIDVLLDDRKERPGIIFADMELIGIPHQLIISDRNLNVKRIEYKHRYSGEKQVIKFSSVVDFMINRIDKSKTRRLFK